MEPEKRCETTELRISDCGHCRDKVYSGPYWDALYATGCGHCQKPIEVHDRVAWSLDGTTTVHAHHRGQETHGV